MNVRQIVIAHLMSIGADGLCAPECGCGIDDLFPCGYCDTDECKPARKMYGVGAGRVFGDALNVDFRPIDTPNEQEETHL